MNNQLTGGIVDYNQRAQLHKPDAEGQRIAVSELVRQGLKARDIAEALRLSLAEVLELMRAPMDA